MNKKRQYSIWQYQLHDLIDEDGQLTLRFNRKDAVSSSETLLYYILHEKIMNRSYDEIEEYEENEKGKKVRVKKNFLPLITIETGRNRTQEDTEKLKRLLQDGFLAYYTDEDGEVTSTHPFVFVDNVLSGSQNKECRQLFVADKYAESVKEYVSLGKEPDICTVSKNLTRNALTTTDVYTVPVDMEKLGICIIPDCEVSIFETVQMVKPYQRTAEEEVQYQELQEWIKQEKAYFDLTQKASKLVNMEECTIPVLKKSNRQKDTYKTVKQWKEENRRVTESELMQPSARIFITAKAKHYPLWTMEQTEEFSEDNLREIPITEWSTELQLVTEENHECKQNVFDGMGLVSKELGKRFEKYLQVKYPITGYQLRLPSIKGFFPCVDFHDYFKKHDIKTITDIWNKPHNVEDIDMLITESTFKAKLNVVGYKENGDEIKKWLFSSIQDYKDRLIQYGYDVIGISNFAKPIEESYRRATYQLWLALNVDKSDMLAFANTQGDLIHKVLSIYRKDELDWKDIRYIESFLHLIMRENPDTNLEKDCADAIKAMHINKRMVFDRKVIRTIKDVIEKKVDDMCLGRMYIKGKYMYITQDILAFLRYAGASDKESWSYSGFLQEKQCYCGGKVIGRKVLARNPIVSYSEITKTEFIDYDGEDADFISHIDNIVQLPLGTECDRLGGADRDGDELFVLDVDDNLKSVQLEFFQNYNYVYTANEESEYYNQNLLEVLNQKQQNHFENKFPNQEVVTLEDYIVPAYVQVNDEDKATALGKEWSKENVTQFILDSDDQTGIITDIDSTIENYANAEGDVTKYALPIAIMKDLQGKMIDASKSGLFDEVVIPEVIRHRFRKRPQFMYFKDGNEFNKDYDSKSALDYLAGQMKKFKAYVERVMVKKTNAKIKAQHFENVHQYMQNLNLKGELVQETIEKLEPLYRTFMKKNKALAILKSHINPYSSDERYKRERKLVDEKFKTLYEETKREAEKICGCPSLLATAAVRLTYINKQSESYSFCWIVASEGILQNLKMNEDNEKIYIRRVKQRDEQTFEWLGEYFTTVEKEEEYPLSFDEGKDMSIPAEYLRDQDGEVEDITDVAITIMGVEKGKAEEIAAELKGKSFRLFENEKRWICIVGDLSIKDKETLKAGIDIRKYIGREIIIKEIVQANPNQTVIKAMIDLKG